MTLDEYLTQRGLESPISDFLTDKMRGNRQLKTERGKKNFEQAAAQAMDDYHTKREAAIAEYNKQVKGYMQLLTKMGYKNITGYLWYVDEELIVKVK